MAGSSNPAWRGFKDIPQNFYGTMLKAAQVRNIEVSISIEDVQELWERSGGRCALTGLPIALTCDKGGRTASLDRIDGKLPYTKNNVQFVHKDINLMKNKFKEDYFLKMCKLVVKHAA
jgi:uncharacterized protein (DUF1919 family)